MVVVVVFHVSTVVIVGVGHSSILVVAAVSRSLCVFIVLSVVAVHFGFGCQ